MWLYFAHTTAPPTIETLDGGFNRMYLLFYSSSQKEKSLCNNANSMLIFSKTQILIFTSQDDSTFVYFVLFNVVMWSVYELIINMGIAL